LEIQVEGSKGKHVLSEMQRCDLIEDSPANRNELLKGFALHDSLRKSET
jgi:hypothetical protein